MQFTEEQRAEILAVTTKPGGRPVGSSKYLEAILEFGVPMTVDQVMAAVRGASRGAEAGSRESVYKCLMRLVRSEQLYKKGQRFGLLLWFNEAGQ